MFMSMQQSGMRMSALQADSMAVKINVEEELKPMEKKQYQRWKKLIAIIMTLLLLLSNVPEALISTLDQVRAAANGEISFTITVQDEKGSAVSGANVKAGSVTLSEEKDGQYTGIVNYETETEEETISVTREGYLSEQKKITLTSGTDVKETFTMKTSTAVVSGTITDETGAAYQGAVVELNGKQVETDDQGRYTLKVEKGNHTLKVTAKEDKYTVYTADVNVESDTTKDVKLERKAFEIKTPSSLRGGSIQVSSGTVSYGESVIYQVTASQSGNSKYLIDSVTVNNEKVREASGQETYQGEIKNITADQTISAVFAAKESNFTLQFSDGDWVNEGEKNSLLGGALSYQKTTGKISIQLDDKYYLSQVSNSETNEEPKIDQTGSRVSIDYGRIGTAYITVKLAADKTAPSITTPDYSHDSQWTKEKITIPVLVTDGESGVSSVTYVWGKEKETVPLKEDGSCEFSITIDRDYEGDCIVTAQDQCGNTEEKSFGIKLDQTAPVISSIEKVPEQKYHNGSVTIKVQASDQGSGVKTIYYNRSEDHQEPALDEKKKVETLEDGSYSIQVPDEEFFGAYYIWAEDQLGNRTGTPQKIEVNIDKTNPVIHNVETSQNAFLFSNKKVTISVKADDNISNGKNLTVYVGTRPDSDDSETEKAVYNSKKDSYQFTIDDKKELKEYKNKTFYVWALDEAGNLSRAVQIPVNIDTTEPKITGITIEKDENSALKTLINHMSFGIFYNESVHVKVTANDNEGGAGIQQVTLYYKPSRDSDDLQPLTKPIDFEGIKGEQSVTADFVLTKDILDGLNWKNDILSLEDRIYAVAEDNAGTGEDTGNISAPLNTELLVLEQNPPEITVEPVNMSDTVVSWKGKDYQCYGKDTGVIITAKDNIDTIGKVQSGIWKIRVTVNGAVVIDDTYEEARSTEPESLTINTGDLKDINGTPVTIDQDGFFHMEAETIDYANNKGRASLTICMDYEAPVVGRLEKSPATAWSAGKVTVQAKDVLDSQAPFVSQVKEVRYSTGTEVEKAAVAEKIGDTVYQFEVDEECERTYSVWAIDEVGHVSDRKTIAVNIDKTPPEIVKFSFVPKGYQESEGDDLKNAVELADYGFYFKEAVTVTVKANDVFQDAKKKNRPSSGVKLIEYYTVDKDGNRVFTGKKDVDENNEITFLIPKDFKGQIYAKATDQVMNTPKDKAETMEVDDGYVHPDGSVVESDAMHEKSADIIFDWKKSSKKDAKAQNLYQKNVPVNITVSDTFSGIRQVEWKVTSPYDTEENQKGTLVVDNSGRLTKDADGWNTDNRDKNLVSRVTKKITVSNNSNDIKVWVKLTDRAGNTSQNSIQFSIDKTAPKIQVTYDNHSYDRQFTKGKKYYKAARTATVTVTERNFAAKDVVSSIQNAYGKAPKIGKWTKHYNKENPDETTYTTKLSYRADGDYTFDIAYTDRAGNKAAKLKTDKFVVDKTAPVIKVTYNNNSAQNGSYYNKARTATITITEKNFETSRIKINGSARRSGKGISFPGAGSWSTKGDTHTAAIHYSADGDYTFDIAYIDKAGNQANKYSTDKFTVDQTKPKLTISGVANESANKGKVAPVISWSDINLSGNASMTLTAYNRKGQVQYKGTYSNLSNGKKFTFADFEHKKEVDDIYTLTASVKDKAGNVTKQTIRFSINRFGSVYTFAEDVKSIEGRYINKEKNIVVTETNVDSLDLKKIRVKIVKDGTAKNLVPNQDFSMKKTGKEGTWSQYIYTIYAANFTDEGQYTITISSEDRAGNINETIDERKGVNLSFGVDKTAPVIVPVNLEDAVTYAENGKKIVVDITDNLMLEKAEFYLNGKRIEAKEEKDGYTFHIDQSNQKQNIRIAAFDAAGNQTEKEVKDFYVTTNLWIRWYTNQVVFISTVTAAAALLLALHLFLFLRKRDREDTEEGQK